MARNIRITEYTGIDEVLGHFETEPLYDEVREFFLKLYPDGYGDIDTSPSPGDPEFTISVEDGDERCDFYAENRYTVNLPSRDAAERLASILGGKVEED